MLEIIYENRIVIRCCVPEDFMMMRRNYICSHENPDVEIIRSYSRLYRESMQTHGGAMIAFPSEMDHDLYGRVNTWLYYHYHQYLDEAYRKIYPHCLRHDITCQLPLLAEEEFRYIPFPE